MPRSIADLLDGEVILLCPKVQAYGPYSAISQWADVVLLESTSGKFWMRIKDRKGNLPETLQVKFYADDDVREGRAEELLRRALPYIKLASRNDLDNYSENTPTLYEDMKKVLGID